MSSIPDWHWEGWHLSIFGLTINYFKCTTLGSFKFLWFIPDFKISNTFKSISLDLLRIDSDEHDGAKSRTSNCSSHIHISRSFKYLLYFQFVEFEWSLASMNGHKKITRFRASVQGKPDLGRLVSDTNFGPTSQNRIHCIFKSLFLLKFTLLLSISSQNRIIGIHYSNLLHSRNLVTSLSTKKYLGYLKYL